MIKKEEIEHIISGYIAENNMFLVDLKISSQNRIKLFVDKQEGIKIQECIGLSRFIESKLDREQEDFELEVTSPGIGEPFKIKQQYTKAVTRSLKVRLTDNSEHKGTLLKAGDNEITLEVTEKVKKQGDKKKKKEQKIVTISYSQIKEAKEIINF